MSNYRNSGYERKERDFYPTPDCYTDWLMHVASGWFSKEQSVLEPAAGEGDMVRQLEAHGFQVVASDITDGPEFDFTQGDWSASQIITNPPYGKLAEKFVRQALKATQSSDGIVAMLLPYDWDAAGGRADLFSYESPFLCKIAINQRVKWIEGSKSSGQHNYCWLIWDWAMGRDQMPFIEYMPKRKEWSDDG